MRVGTRSLNRWRDVREEKDRGAELWCLEQQGRRRGGRPAPHAGSCSTWGPRQRGGGGRQPHKGQSRGHPVPSIPDMDREGSRLIPAAYWLQVCRWPWMSKGDLWAEGGVPQTCLWSTQALSSSSEPRAPHPEYQDVLSGSICTSPVGTCSVHPGHPPSEQGVEVRVSARLTA